MFAAAFFLCGVHLQQQREVHAEKDYPCSKTAKPRVQGFDERTENLGNREKDDREERFDCHLCRDAVVCKEGKVCPCNPLTALDNLVVVTTFLVWRPEVFDSLQL